MRSFVKGCVVAVCIIFIVGTARAQSATSMLQQAAEQYAQGYAQPAADMFSAVLNSGQFHSAGDNGFHVYVSLQMTGAIVPDAEKSFSPSFNYFTGNNPGLPPQLQNQNLQLHFSNVPTILGGQSNQYLIDTAINGTRYTYGKLPGGIGASYIPFIVPHIEIGSIAGTELLLRFMPSTQINSGVGSVSFYGIGLRHSLSQYLPIPLVNIAVQLMYQHLAAGDNITMSTWNLALLGSVDLPIITLYGGIQLEEANMQMNYTFNQPELPVENINFSLNTTQNARLTLGATIKLLLFDVNAQYTYANIPTFGAGIGVRLPPSIF